MSVIQSISLYNSVQYWTLFNWRHCRLWIGSGSVSIHWNCVVFSTMFYAIFWILYIPVVLSLVRRRAKRFCSCFCSVLVLMERSQIKTTSNDIVTDRSLTLLRFLYLSCSMFVVLSTSDYCFILPDNTYTAVCWYSSDGCVGFMSFLLYDLRIHMHVYYHIKSKDWFGFLWNYTQNKHCTADTYIYPYAIVCLYVILLYKTYSNFSNCVIGRLSNSLVPDETPSYSKATSKLFENSHLIPISACERVNMLYSRNRNKYGKRIH